MIVEENHNNVSEGDDGMKIYSGFVPRDCDLAYQLFNGRTEGLLSGKACVMRIKGRTRRQMRTMIVQR